MHESIQSSVHFFTIDSTFLKIRFTSEICKFAVLYYYGIINFGLIFHFSHALLHEWYLLFARHNLVGYFRRKVRPNIKFSIGAAICWCYVYFLPYSSPTALPLVFTQGSGSLFITDLPVEATPLNPEVEIIELVQEPFFASVLESKSVELISEMEKVILEDPGKRGVAHLLQESDLLKSVLVLSHADRVAVTTGFPVCEDQEVKEETDGLPGALSICQALLALGKDVTLLCDNSAYQLYQSCIDHMTSLGALKNTVDVLSYSTASELVKSAEGGSPPWDVLLAIERAGRNKQGSHCTMSGRTVEVEPMDDIFVSLNSHPLVSTICIGDGGNELGMGKVYDKVVEHIPKGDIIACETACDYVVAAGVSNWAGIAISLGLYVVSQSPVHWRYRNHAVDADHTPDWPLDCFIPTDQQVCIEIGDIM